MATVRRTAHYPTEFRAEISHWVGGFLAPTPVRDKSHATNPRRDTNGTDAGGTGRRFRRQLPGQQQCGSAAAKPMKQAFAGRTRRASFIRPTVPDVSSFDLAAMDASRPTQNREGQKEMYVRRRIRVNPPAHHSRDRRHTQGPVHAERAS